MTNLKTVTDMFSPMCETMHQTVSEIQSNIVDALEAQDGKKFKTDTWTRAGGGGGVTRVLEDGNVFEKAGVNVSAVTGEITEKEAPMFQTLLARVNSPIKNAKGACFFATGVSLVIHPNNPFVPTTHANYRYFELSAPEGSVWWFGGGADLTPYYLFEEDAIHFHATHKDACDTLSAESYSKYKADCDEYFYLPHREETRGIGGIFFDYLNNQEKDTIHEFIKKGGQAFIDAYIPIVQKRKETPYTEAQQDWQHYRRGRYVEFNLLYDRGTLFGLKTNGRIESILMSLPAKVAWKYDYHPEEGTEEAKLEAALKLPRDWV